MFKKSGVKAFIKTIAATGALLLGDASAQADHGPSYTDPLPANPVDITRAFFVDHTAWNGYSHAHYQKTKDFDVPQAAYRRLIDLYCGPDKQHQGITFSSDPDFDTERAEIVGESDNGDAYSVMVRHTDDNGFVATYNFAFKRGRDAWRLEEVYYFDDYGEEWLPRL